MNTADRVLRLLGSSCSVSGAGGAGGRGHRKTDEGTRGGVPSSLRQKGRRKGWVGTQVVLSGPEWEVGGRGQM